MKLTSRDAHGVGHNKINNNNDVDDDDDNE